MADAMIQAAIEGIILICLVFVAGTTVVHAYSNPRGAYLRIVGWTIGALGAALLLIVVLGAFSSSAAGLGLALIFAALVATIAVVAGLAFIAATAGHIRNRQR
jgi:hypothetical protein